MIKAKNDTPHEPAPEKEDASPKNQEKPRVAWWMFGALTLIGLLNFGVLVTNKMAEGETGRMIYPFINEMTGAYTLIFLFPLLFWFFRRFPLERGNLMTRIPLYLLVSILFGMSHTLLMKFSRSLIYPLAGLGAYDYGIMSYRFLMEYFKQILIFWMVYGTGYFIQSERRRRNERMRTMQLEQELTKARLQALQMQLNPHFLFNTLNMISSTMYENIDAADKMIAYLSDLLRITLNRTNQEEYPLYKEMELIDLYLEIMRARFSDKLSVETSIDPEVHDALVPGFILQPLIENSIKYGMEGLGEVTIKLMAGREGEHLVLVVEDNGPGLPHDADRPLGTGIGLSNTEERLDKLYGASHRFVIENAEAPATGLTVLLEIPFRSEKAA